MGTGYLIALDLKAISLPLSGHGLSESKRFHLHIVRAQQSVISSVAHASLQLPLKRSRYTPGPFVRMKPCCPCSAGAALGNSVATALNSA